MTLVQTEPKSIKIGNTDLKKICMWVGGTEKQIRPAYKPRTFTISWTEQSNMSSGWTYSDDAAGLTAGDSAFDEFFGYSAVRLNTSGVETAEITQTQSGGAGKLDITQLGTLTSGDNVMIKFPVRGIKMTKNGSTVTLSITKELGRESEGYQYYAHSRGDFTTPIIKNNFYIGTYMGGFSGSVLKSWSGASPAGGNTLSSFISKARANDGNTGSAGYDIIGFYQKEYINALYMMKYGNTNGQATIGLGNVNGSRVSTGGTNSQINATYGTSSGTQQMKLFGIEDFRGNQKQILGGVGCASSDGSIYTTLSNFPGTIGTSSPRTYTGTKIPSSNGYISSIAATNMALFLGTAVSGSNSTYYCDEQLKYQPAICACGGGNDASLAGGPFNMMFRWTPGQSGADLGTRLMYL